MCVDRFSETKSLIFIRTTQFHLFFVTLLHCDIEIPEKLSTVNDTRHSRKMGAFRDPSVASTAATLFAVERMVRDIFYGPRQNDPISYVLKYYWDIYRTLTQRFKFAKKHNANNHALRTNAIFFFLYI